MAAPISLVPYQTSRPHIVPVGGILTVTPDVGATAKVEYTKGTGTDIANGVAVWAPWAKGTVSAATSDMAEKTLHVRVTAIGGNVTMRVTENPAQSDVASLTVPDWGVAASIIVSSAAPNNADGTPDGTIYVQTA